MFSLGGVLVQLASKGLGKVPHMRLNWRLRERRKGLRNTVCARLRYIFKVLVVVVKQQFELFKLRGFWLPASGI